jgi:hypothetical protein
VRAALKGARGEVTFHLITADCFCRFGVNPRFAFEQTTVQLKSEINFVFIDISRLSFTAFYSQHVAVNALSINFFIAIEI